MKDFKSRLQAYIDKEVERRVERRLHEILDSLGLQPDVQVGADVKKTRARAGQTKAPRKQNRRPVSEETRAKMREAWARRKARQSGMPSA